MKIKNFVEKTTNFLIKRLSELVGIIILGSSILLFVSLVSYSPEDPNFIFPENVEIKNLLGAKGSYVSDFLYQSIGFISLLVPVSFILISLSVIIDKKILYILESLFFIILYSITGALFFTVFHTETYWLTINGNNGFLGNLFEETFFVNLINLNRQISYFILIILISLFFLLSINFKINHIKFVIKIFSKSKKEIPKSIVENYNENSLSETDYVKNETRIQENFTFEKNNDSPGRKIIKYKLPSLEFLKIPTKKDRNLSENKIDEKTLEKILLDFGVEGEVKNITEFGLFVGLQGDIDGMVHLSDISWDERGEDAIQNFKKGDIVKAIVSEVDVEKERISLSIKALGGDKFAEATGNVKRGSVITVEIKSIEEGGIEVEYEGMKSFIRKSDLSRDRAEQRPERFSVGDKVDVRVTNIDNKTRKLGVSIKAREIAEEKEAVEQYGSSDSGASLGDILGAALKTDD